MTNPDPHFCNRNHPKVDGLTQRQELFTLEYCKTGDPVAAYKASYKAGGNAATIQREINRLLRRDDVKKRIAEIRETMREQMVITQADIVRELWRNSEEAQKTGKITASNQALVAIGNSLGMFEPKPRNEPEGVVHKLTAEERRALKAALETERDRRAGAPTTADRPGDAFAEPDRRTLN